MTKKKVILHDIEYTIGGPKTVLNGIINSPLKEQYDFVKLKQSVGCGFNPIKAIWFICHYRKLINREHAESIYICGLQYTGFLMTIAAKLSNVKKVVVSVHGSDWDNPDGTFRKWLLMHIIEPLTVMLTDSVFTVCEAAQRTIGALRTSPKHNDGVVYNTFPGIDEFSIPEGEFRREQNISNDKILVSIVGRVVKAKGHQYIIEAIKRYDNPNYIFVVVGSGDYLEQYKQRCETEINSGKLRLLGVRSDVLRILKDTDIFLFATLNENHSMALLEAVNMRCAALVTNVGGNPEIIEDNVSGILIPPYNSDAIIKGLNVLIDGELRRRYTENAYNYAKVKFSVDNTYGKLGRILTFQR